MSPFLEPMVDPPPRPPPSLPQGFKEVLRYGVIISLHTELPLTTWTWRTLERWNVQQSEVLGSVGTAYAIKNLLDMPWKSLFQKQCCDQDVPKPHLGTEESLEPERRLAMQVEKLIDEAWKNTWETVSMLSRESIHISIYILIVVSGWAEQTVEEKAPETLQDDPEVGWRMVLIKAWFIMQLFLLAMFLSILNHASSAGLVVWKKRLKSTSVCMPWSIAPALLVLWSVVWMFRPTPAAQYSDWYGPDHHVASSLPLQPDPILADLETHSAIPWNFDISLSNYENGFGHPGLWSVGVDSVEFDSNHFDSSAYPTSHDGATLPSSTQDLPMVSAVPVSSNLAPNSNIPSGYLPPAIDTPASIPVNFGGTARCEASELPAPSELPQMQRMQTDMHNGVNTNASGVVNDQKKTDKRKAPPMCEICNREFRYPKDVKRHIATVHQRTKVYSCDFPGCEHQDSREDNLRRHKLSHVQRSDPGRDCGSTSSAPLQTPSMKMTAQSGGKKRGHRDITRAESSPRAESSTMARNNSSTTEQQDLRVKELEAQLQEERRKRIRAEDEVRDLENKLYEEQSNRFELENKVKGFKNAIEALNGNVGEL